MTKKILFGGSSLTPQQVLSEQFGAVYPSKVDTQDDGKKVLEAQVVVGYDPSTGKFVDQVVDNVYNPATSAFEAQRTPTVFKYAAASAAGNTAVWTPASGKKFRLMGFILVPSAGLAAAGQTLLKLTDGATDWGMDLLIYLPIAASIVAQAPIIVNLPGNGHLSTTADNVLNANLSAALTAGAFSITAWGTEE